MDHESIHWTFSAAAQSLSAVVAFLLAGYALVYGAMETQVTADESLREVTDDIEQRYHWVLGALLSLAVFAILADLLVVWSNKADTWAPVWAQCTGAATTILSLAGAALFVIWVVDPRKHKAAALRFLGGGRPAAGRPAAPAADFFTEFQSIERTVRRLWRIQGGQERLSRRPGPTPLREAVEVLKLGGILPEDLAGEVSALIRQRNAIYHGEVETVEAAAVEQAKRVGHELDQL